MSQLPILPSLSCRKGQTRCCQNYTEKNFKLSRVLVTSCLWDFLNKEPLSVNRIVLGQLHTIICSNNKTAEKNKWVAVTDKRKRFKMSGVLFPVRCPQQRTAIHFTFNRIVLGQLDITLTAKKEKPFPLKRKYHLKLSQW